MNCTDCDACCRWIVAAICRTREEIIFWRTRGAHINGNVALVPLVCPNLENGKCKIQNSKPLSCRTFRAGDVLCKMCRKAEGIE